MSKKSKFNNQGDKANEFEEKAEEELEENEKICNNNKNKNNIELPKDNQDPFDISNDEDEDKISDLNRIPNFFEIPKPSGGFKPPLPPSGENPLIQKYEHLIYIKFFPFLIT